MAVAKSNHLKFQVLAVRQLHAQTVTNGS